MSAEVVTNYVQLEFALRKITATTYLASPQSSTPCTRLCKGPRVHLTPSGCTRTLCGTGLKCPDFGDGETCAHDPVSKQCDLLLSLGLSRELVPSTRMLPDSLKCLYCKSGLPAGHRGIQVLWIRRAFTSPSLTSCKGGDEVHHPGETRGSGGHDLHRRDRACKSSESRCRAGVEKIKGGKEQELLKVNVCGLPPPSSVSNPSWEGNAPSYLKGPEWLAPALTSPSEVVRDSCT